MIPVTRATDRADDTQTGDPGDPAGSLAQRVGRVGAAVVLAIGLYHLVSFLALCWETVPYRYPLEWMEGGMAEVVARAMSGLGIYTAPSAEYVPFIYPPLYFWISAVAAEWAGLQLSTLRLVSVAATLGSLTLIYFILRREGIARWLCATGALYFLATFEHSGSWFHLARIDNLFVCLLLAVVLLLRGSQDAHRAVAAGVLLSAAFLTKQTAFIALGPLFAALSWLEPRRAWIAGGTAAAISAAALAVLHLTSNGWSSFFLLELPRKHELMLALWHSFWLVDVLPHFALPLLLAAIGLCLMGVQNRQRALFFGALLAGCTAAAWISRLHLGGHVNGLMPLHACIAILLPLALDAIRLASERRWRSARARWLVAIGIPGAALLLFLLLGDPWEGRRPTEIDRREGDAYVELLSDIQGDVFVWGQRFVQTYAGKRSFGSDMGVGDVVRGGGEPAAQLKREIRDAVRQRRFAALVFSGGAPFWLRDAVARHYTLTQTFPGENFVPVIGLAVRPRTIYLPRGRADDRNGIASDVD